MDAFYASVEQRDNPPLDAIAKTRDIAVREGWCYQHVQAIIVASTSMPKQPRATGSISRIPLTQLAGRAK
jgi:hypothetical protein